MIRSVTVKSILNKKKKRDDWFLDDYTINPFSGCSFNCLYCYIRGSRYGIHMEEKLSIKENALVVLDKQLKLRARKNQYGIIVLASATEPYLQAEKELKLTRGILELILQYRFPLHIITKSDLVRRDFDLIRDIEKNAILPPDLEGLKRRTFITFSFSTLDDAVGKIFEPGATAPSTRLQALGDAVVEGFHAGVSLMPLLPFISDTDDELEKMFSAFQKSGAKYIFPASLTLFGYGPADSKTLMLRAISKHYPHLAEQYRSIFSSNFQPDPHYQRSVNSRTNAFLQKFGFVNSLKT